MTRILSSGPHLRTMWSLDRMIWPQTRGRLAQLARALARHARGQWFKSTIAHHLTARLTKKQPLSRGAFVRGWWRQGDSNPRPLRCERSALPAELCPRDGEFSRAPLANEGGHHSLKLVVRAPVAQRKEQWFPKPCAQVRVLPGVPLFPWGVTEAQRSSCLAYGFG